LIVISCLGLNGNGEKTLKFFGPSINQAGHNSEAAAKGVKHAINQFLGDDVVSVTRIMEDSGGGGGEAVQHLDPKLIDFKLWMKIAAKKPIMHYMVCKKHLKTHQRIQCDIKAWVAKLHSKCFMCFPYW